MKHLLTVLLTSLLLLTCKENPLEIEPNYPPGRRDYTWTADTIKDHVWFNKFVGESVNDIWAVNMYGSANDCIYKYDGNKWYPFTMNLNEPIYELISAYKYWNSVWFTSRNGDIWKYNVGSIKKEATFKYENDNMLLFDIAGKSDNEIYAFGGRWKGYNRDGSILHYNGYQWVLKKLLKESGGFVQSSYSYRNNKYYLYGYVDNELSNDKHIIYEYDGLEVKNISENEESLAIGVLDGFLILTKGQSVYWYHENKFELLFTITNAGFGGCRFGRNKNDLLIRMKDGIMHWNGTDIQYILKLNSNIYVRDMHVLEKDIFVDILDYNKNKTIIYHGVLK